MILGKLAKTGALVASVILIGGLLSYNSEKTKIINGIDYLKNTAIEAKNEVSQVTAQRDKLKEEQNKNTSTNENETNIIIITSNISILLSQLFTISDFDDTEMT